MKIKMLKSKLHQACVTDSNVEYEGSFGIDSELMDAVGFYPYEKVLIANIANGNRFETYVIPEAAGSRRMVLNGAAALLVLGGTTRGLGGAEPLARIVGTAVAGVDPSSMGIGPVPATRKVLQRTGLSINDIELVELNEAFAAQAIACIRELKLEPERVNIHGGAIALGHPLGCTGARILTTLVHSLERTGSRYGLATMCIGVGQGIAMVVERL